MDRGLASWKCGEVEGCEVKGKKLTIQQWFADLLKKYENDPDFLKEGFIFEQQEKIEELQKESDFFRLALNEMTSIKGDIEVNLQKLGEYNKKLLDENVILINERNAANRAVEAMEKLKLTGHNDDCLFCGFKDKIIQELEGKSCTV